MMQNFKGVGVKFDASDNPGNTFKTLHIGIKY